MYFMKIMVTSKLGIYSRGKMRKVDMIRKYAGLERRGGSIRIYCLLGYPDSAHFMCI